MMQIDRFNVFAWALLARKWRLLAYKWLRRGFEADAKSPQYQDACSALYVECLRKAVTIERAIRQYANSLMVRP